MSTMPSTRRCPRWRLVATDPSVSRYPALMAFPKSRPTLGLSAVPPIVIGTTAMSSWRIREVRTERPRVVRADILHVELRDLEHTRRFVRVPANDSQHGLVPIDAPEARQMPEDRPPRQPSERRRDEQRDSCRLTRRNGASDA
jgi:hypothetical protein